MKKSKQPAPVGRPSLYDPKYCNEVIDFCAQGFSLTAFAGKIRVARDTIAEWGYVHPEFSEAIKIAKACAAYSLETDAGKVRKTGGGPGTAAMIIFGLKNFAPDEYQDRREPESLTPDQLALIAASPKLDTDELGPQSPRL